MFFRVLFLLVFSQSALAQTLTFRVTGIAGKVLVERKIENPQGSSSFVGSLSDQTLGELLSKKSLTEYQGSDAGVQSINELGSALEVLSDTEMNAYGWCFQIDGKISDLLADQQPLESGAHVLEWFYAYAHLNKTTWTAMCVPADHKPQE